MIPLLSWITAVCIFAPLSLGAPQLFPFSSLGSYFDHQTRNGPGGAESVVLPQIIKTAETTGNIARVNGGERFPRNHLPANHRPASLTEQPVFLPEQVASPVSYEIIIPHRIHQGIVNTPPAATTQQAYLLQNIFKPPPENQKPVVFYTEVTTKPWEKVETVSSLNISISPSTQPPTVEEKQSIASTNISKSPEKMSKDNVYPKKWQPSKEASKKTTVKSVSGPEPTVKEKREPGKHHKNSFLPIHGPPRGIAEQEASETGFAGVTAGVGGLGGGGGDRVQFHMHGIQGPHSYKFGYDTGKGHNRQFRYEERDNHGHVKGHYGFYNKHGKLQIVNYEAHPEHGFHADGNFGKHSII